MKLWTYLEARTKLQEDEDLQDETFVLPNELIGYFNEGIEEAESEIQKVDPDYFLTSYPIPLVQGQAIYAYPVDIYAFKARGLVYANGSIIYDVKRFRRNNKFENLAFADQYAQTEDYRWFHTNPSAGNAQINLKPPARETAIVPPNASPFTPLVLWYIRHASRIPRLGEYVPQWGRVAQNSGVDTAADALLTASTFATGDMVKVASTSSLPSPLVAGTVYYVIRMDATHIQLATSLANAQAAIAIDLTTTGVGILTISIAASQAIIDNTLIEIPEFTKFVIEWAKCRTKNKEGDPRLSTAGEILKQQKQQMIETLGPMADDDQNDIEPDFSPYTEMS